MKPFTNRLLIFCSLLSPVIMISAYTSSEKNGAAAGSITYPVYDESLKADTILFAGLKWIVRNTEKAQMPGPNYWSKANVFVNAKGYLHLKLAKDAATGNWKCAEVVSTTKMGFGTYQWQLESRVDTLDHNLVFGLFNYSGNDEHDEMDIEFSKWGHPENNKNLNYTIWPTADVSIPRNVEIVQNFALTTNASTHRFTRTASSLSFKSLYGFHDDNTGLFAEKTWKTPTSISLLEMPVHMNIWCFKGKPPTNGADVEIVVRDFKYKPL